MASVNSRHLKLMRVPEIAFNYSFIKEILLIAYFRPNWSGGLYYRVFQCTWELREYIQNSLTLIIFFLLFLPEVYMSLSVYKVAYQIHNSTFLMIVWSSLNEIYKFFSVKNGLVFSLKGVQLSLTGWKENFLNSTKMTLLK